MAQLVLRTFGVFYVILSLVTMITPSTVANSFFHQNFHPLDIDNYTLIIMDLFRLVGVFMFVAGAFMFGISRTPGSESSKFSTVVFLIFSVIGLFYSVFHAVMSTEFRWKFTSSTALLLLFLVQTLSIGFSMIASRRRNANSTSLPSTNGSYSMRSGQDITPGVMGFGNQTPYNPNPSIHTNYYNTQQPTVQPYQQSWNSGAFPQSYNGFNSSGFNGFDSFGSDQSLRKRN